jgi:histidinol-phosphate/aromatic aminotransferase/cobyric acid decarboxylase-like protein/GNAT superfamily N-acetyltransferase
VTTIDLTLATPEDRDRIYAIRHEVYAVELGQHPVNDAGFLRDALDEVNTYIVAKVGGAVAGFVALTPPTPAGYSIDKYFRRDDLPFSFDAHLYEVRLLTVSQPYRHSWLGGLLMYAALRFLESRGARTIVAIGRVELLELYTRAGLRPLGRRAISGAVTYELMSAPLAELAGHLAGFQTVLERLERHVSWRLPGVTYRALPCYHGGAFFSAIGESFDTLERKDTVISADVLDAWFEPAPTVLRKLETHLAFALRTSPPTHGAGLQRAIAAARGVAEDSILPGAGSSDLIFAGLTRWVAPASRVLILDPMYGEYAHVLERVIGASVDRFRLPRGERFDVDGPALTAACLERRYDWVVLVNPNSPTGRHVPRPILERLLDEAPRATRFWIDETYVDYVGADQSLEDVAAASTNVVVCKSMSKAYALSGARVAYLCGPPGLIDDLRRRRPPWSVSLPGQIAACEALGAIDYYRAQWQTTHVLRSDLQRRLEELGWEVVPGCANFLLCSLPSDGPDAAELVKRVRQSGLFLREVADMGSTLGRYDVRVAVKDGFTNQRMLEILCAAGVRSLLRGA